MTHVRGHQDPMPPDIQIISRVLLGIALAIIGVVLALVSINLIKYTDNIKDTGKTDDHGEHLD